MGSDPRPPTDYRGMQKRQERQLVFVAMALLVLGGATLTAFVFGLEAALGALPWLMLGALGILGFYLVWVALSNWADR